MPSNVILWLILIGVIVLILIAAGAVSISA